MKFFKFTVIVFLLLIQLFVKAQDFSKLFGKITDEEINLKQYKPDKDAEAVVLFDKGKSHFVYNNGFEIVFERSTRLKILSEAGMEWATIEIPYYHKGTAYEAIKGLEAYTYNYENGKCIKTELDLKNCYDEKINEYWMVKKFTFPNVKVGSIIEYKYRLYSTFLEQLRDWEFQATIPTISSTYEVRMIPFCNYTWLLQGASKFDSQKAYEDKNRDRHFGRPDGYGNNTYHDMVYVFGMKNVPAFKDEEYITSKNDYIIKLDFQLSNIYYLNGVKQNFISTWPELIKELEKSDSFGKYVKKSKKMASKLLSLDEMDYKSEEEKFDCILNYVKENYNWNNRNSRYANKSTGEFVDDKYGNCAEINLFTVGLLQACGLNAFPILSSTRTHGKIRVDYPYRHFFNYVLIGTHVDGKVIISDATDILCLNNRIPLRCINDRGLMITDEIKGWAGLKCDFVSENNTNLTINFNDSDIITRLETTATEYSAYNLRHNYGDNNEEIIEKLEKKGRVVFDSSLVVLNQYNIKEPYVIKYKKKGLVEDIMDKLYIPPFQNEVLSDNPLKQNERSYPIDMIYSANKSYCSTITIPDGYSIDFLPEEYSVDNDIVNISYSVQEEDEELKVKFNYYFKESVYSSKDYLKLKYYFNEIVKKGNEKIVFKKIS